MSNIYWKNKYILYIIFCILYIYFIIMLSIYWKNKYIKYKIKYLELHSNSIVPRINSANSKYLKNDKDINYNIDTKVIPKRNIFEGSGNTQLHAIENSCNTVAINVYYMNDKIGYIIFSPYCLYGKLIPKYTNSMKKYYVYLEKNQNYIMNKAGNVFYTYQFYLSKYLCNRK